MSDRQSIQHGHVGSHQRQRWFQVKNMEYSEAIPSFGVIMLDPTDRNDFFTHNVVDEQIIWRGWKTTALGEQLAEPWMFLFNGPTAIPPQSVGKATQDWPALVLHDGGNDRLPNGVKCGPIAESWYIWSGGNGFFNLSHDDARAYPATNGIHTVWCAPSVSLQTPSGLATSGGSFEANAKIDGMVVDLEPATTIEFDSANDLWLIYRPGIYWVSFSATLSAALTVSENTVLRLTARKSERPAYAWGDTSLTAHRVHCVDTIGPGSPYYGGSAYALAENVAASGPIQIESASKTEPAKIALYNRSDVTVAASDVIFSVFALRADREADGSLHYT